MDILIISFSFFFLLLDKDKETFPSRWKSKAASDPKPFS